MPRQLSWQSANSVSLRSRVQLPIVAPYYKTTALWRFFVIIIFMNNEPNINQPSPIQRPTMNIKKKMPKNQKIWFIAMIISIIMESFLLLILGLWIIMILLTGSLFCSKDGRGLDGATCDKSIDFIGSLPSGSEILLIIFAVVAAVCIINYFRIKNNNKRGL